MCIDITSALFTQRIQYTQTQCKEGATCKEGRASDVNVRRRTPGTCIQYDIFGGNFEYSCKPQSQ